MSLPLLAAYEISGDVLCPDCLGLYKQDHPVRPSDNVIPLFSAELKRTDQCVVCKRFLLADPVDA